MVITPLKKKDGTVYKNVELVKIYYNKLNDLKNGAGAKNESEREKMEDTFYKICGGSDNATQLMDFMAQIVNEPDERAAQRLLERGLIPVDIKK